jgi:hypothetical protein
VAQTIGLSNALGFGAGMFIRLFRTKKARFRGLFDLVAGAGFEPAAFRL